MTEKDMDIAECIFGLDIGALKEKATRSKPYMIREDQIAMPSEIIAKKEDIILCMDVYHISGIPIFGAIDKMVRY